MIGKIRRESIFWEQTFRKGTVKMDLLEIRNEIDGIDAQIVELYEKRMEVCKKVAQYKIETGKKVFDKVREEEKIKKVKFLKIQHKCGIICRI